MLIVYLGYLASLLVAISLSLKDIKWLRIINLLGCIAFVIYGLGIDAMPVVIANAYIAFINIFHLYKLRK